MHPLLCLFSYPASMSVAAERACASLRGTPLAVKRVVAHGSTVSEVGKGRSIPFGTHAAESVATSMRQRRSLRSGLQPQRILPTRPQLNTAVYTGGGTGAGHGCILSTRPQLWPSPVPPMPSPSCPRARARGRGRTKLGKHLLQIVVRLRRRLKVQQVVLTRVRLPFVC